MKQDNPKPGFNLSRWALEHGALTRYLMLVLLVLGMASYFQLGQDEDPPFTFRAMVVRAYWPGATAQQMAEQVTDKMERALQEVPFAYKIRSFSKPGETTVFFEVKDSTKAAEVANLWYVVRKKLGDIRYTLPAGVQGPFFNDEFGDVYGVIYALESDGFSDVWVTVPRSFWARVASRAFARYAVTTWCTSASLYSRPNAASDAASFAVGLP